MTNLKSTTSIRAALLRSVVSLIVILTACLLGVIAFSVRQNVKQLCQQNLRRAALEMELQLVQYFGPFEKGMALAGGWAEAGMFDDRAPEQLNALLLPIVSNHETLASIQIADLHGWLYRITPRGDGWQTIEVHGGQATLTVLKNGAATTAPASHPDHREQAWYLESLAAWDRVAGGASPAGWTLPHQISTGRPGMAIGRVVQDRAGNVLVIAFETEIEAISEFTTQLEPSENGLAVVVDSERHTVGLPALAPFKDPERRERSLLRTPEELGSTTIVDGLEAWRDQDSQGDLLFRSGGERWWGTVRGFPLAGDQAALRIGVVVPERDFLGDFAWQRWVLALVAFAMIGVAVLFSIGLAGSYSRPIRHLVASSRRIRELDLEAVEIPATRITEIAELSDAQEKTRSALDSFARYVPIGLVRQLMRRGEAAQIGGESREVTILFTDIRGFTSIAERLDAETLTTHMSDYFQRMCDALHEHNATIDKFIGDAIMAFWNAPEDDVAHEANAIRAVLACQSALAIANEEWQARGLPALPTRCGVTTGFAIVGNVGASDRLSYTLLGDTVNLASRLEALNERYGTMILVGEPTYLKCRDTFEWREIDTVAVKGKAQGVTVFEPLGLPGSSSPDRLERVRSYEAALAKYRARDFSSAVSILESLIEAEPGDTTPTRLAEACQRFVESPPPGDWDGVTRMTSK